MIYLSTQSTAQVVWIPNNGPRIQGEIAPPYVSAEFTLRSTTQREEVYTMQANIAISTALYHHVAITLPEGPEQWHTGLKTGEYEYTLTSMGRTLSTGIAQVGEYTRTATPSEQGGITFKQGK